MQRFLCEPELRSHEGVFGVLNHHILLYEEDEAASERFEAGRGGHACEHVPQNGLTILLKEGLKKISKMHDPSQSQLDGSMRLTLLSAARDIEEVRNRIDLFPMIP
ncbi:hypothetical protein KSP40_PGU001203 [Platanthera guangdongensis]|uniref:Uncharacterized protein n=1 Tax=Platanthera guangdongensis TaxID=2320717 RepID=A0ABR2N2R3_9ASPA